MKSPARRGREVDKQEREISISKARRQIRSEKANGVRERAKKKKMTTGTGVGRREITKL